MSSIQIFPAMLFWTTVLVNDLQSSEEVAVAWAVILLFAVSLLEAVAGSRFHRNSA